MSERALIKCQYTFIICNIVGHGSYNNQSSIQRSAINEFDGVKSKLCRHCTIVANKRFAIAYYNRTFNK